MLKTKQASNWYEEFFKPGKKQLNPLAFRTAAQQILEEVEPWSAGAAGYRINILIDGDYEKFFSLTNKTQHLSAAQAYCADKRTKGDSTSIERNVFNSGSLLSKDGLSEDNFDPTNAKSRLVKVLYRTCTPEYLECIADVSIVLEFYGRSVYDELQGEAHPLLQTFTWRISDGKMTNTEPKVWTSTETQWNPSRVSG
jgi:hypothetical protein